MSHIQKSTLVPVSLIKEQEAGCFLRSVYPDIPQDAVISVREFPQYEAVLVYLDEGSEPVIGSLAEALGGMEDHNRIAARYFDGALYLAIAQDEKLLLANAYPAPDFTTAEYYIFLAMKSLQLNPEQSVIRFAGELDEEQEMSLGRYFKAVETL